MRRYWTAPLRSKAFRRRTSTVASIERHFPAHHAARRRLKPADAVTVLYSAIFATAAVLDAGSKERLRLRHDEELEAIRRKATAEMEHAAAHVGMPLQEVTEVLPLLQPWCAPVTARHQSRSMQSFNGRRHLTWSRVPLSHQMAYPFISALFSRHIATRHMSTGRRTERSKAAVAADVTFRLLDSLQPALDADRKLDASKRELTVIDRRTSQTLAKALRRKAENLAVGRGSSKQPAASSASTAWTSEQLDRHVNKIFEQAQLQRSQTKTWSLEDVIYKFCAAILENPQAVTSKLYSRTLHWLAHRTVTAPGLAIIDACLPTEDSTRTVLDTFETFEDFERFCQYAFSFCIRRQETAQVERIRKLVESDYGSGALWTDYCRRETIGKSVQRHSTDLYNSVIEAYAHLGDIKQAITKLHSMLDDNAVPSGRALSSIIVACNEKLTDIGSKLDLATQQMLIRSAVIAWLEYGRILRRSGAWTTNLRWRAASAFQAMIEICQLSGDAGMTAKLNQTIQENGIASETLKKVAKGRSGKFRKVRLQRAADAAAVQAASKMEQDELIAAMEALDLSSYAKLDSETAVQPELPSKSQLSIVTTVEAASNFAYA